MSESSARLLKTAMHVVGSEERLALALGVALEDLHRWLRNEADVPPKVILDAIDIIETGHVKGRR